MSAHSDSGRCGEPSPRQGDGGLIGDASAPRGVLDQVDSAIVVGHSYGGTVIAEAGRHPSISHLLYISSYLPDVGMSQGAIVGGESDPVSIRDNEDGTLSVSGYDAASFGARFLQDADRATQQEAWERVTPQDAAAFMTPTTAAGWQGIDSTYIVCAQDRSTSIELQRFHAARATRAVELPTGHHPSLPARPRGQAGGGTALRARCPAAVVGQPASTALAARSPDTRAPWMDAVSR